MNLDSRLLVWRTTENAAALAQHRALAFDGGWHVFPNRAFDAVELSRLLWTAVVEWDSQGATDFLEVRFCLHGHGTRTVSYSADQGWTRKGRAAPCEDARRLAPFFARTDLNARSEVLDVLDAFIGRGLPPTAAFLKKVNAVAPQATGAWDFGGLEKPLARGTPVLVTGVGELWWSDSAEDLVLDHRRAEREVRIEFPSPPGPRPVAWKDLGLFWTRTSTPLPFRPSAAQLEALTDDALAELEVMHRAQAVTRTSFRATRALRQVLRAKPPPPMAPRALWHHLLSMPDSRAEPLAPHKAWQRTGDELTRPLDSGAEPIRVPAPLADRALRCLTELQQSLGKHALGGEGLEALTASWFELGVPVELVIDGLT